MFMNNISFYKWLSKENNYLSLKDALFKNAHELKKKSAKDKDIELKAKEKPKIEIIGGYVYQMTEFPDEGKKN